MSFRIGVGHAALVASCMACSLLTVSAPESGQQIAWPVHLDHLGIRFLAQGPNGNELPQDGVSTCPVEATVRWREPLPLGIEAWNASLYAVDGGDVDPYGWRVPLAAGTQTYRALYRQPSSPRTEDWRVTARAATASAVATDDLMLRKVELVIRREFEGDLYSGTKTARASRDVVVKAWCPTASYLRPSGTIHMSVSGPIGEGVWAKWWDAQGPRWSSSHEQPLGLMRDDSGQEFMGARFTVAADKPGMLHGFGGPAIVSFHLNDTSSSLLAYTQLQVLVPRKPVLTWDEPERAARKRGYFRGTLMWYADEACTKPYPGVHGTLIWQLPQGQVEQEYTLPRTGEPAPFTSVPLTVAGCGSLEVRAEQGFGRQLPVLVLRRGQKRPTREQRKWLEWPRPGSSE